MAHELKEEEIQLVVFLLNQVEFACYIEHVREVLKKVKITPLPKMPQFVEGVVNLRGEVIPVIDLRKRFDLPVIENEGNRIIMVDVASNMFGLIVDTVEEVLRLDASKIQPPPSGLTGDSGKIIEGIG
ncbi:MAG: chemotaxis protein CheW, partial [Firmicutes bacterium]|nr:chemotaxis protein CheW [Bacillota bacterium]